jgi:polyisoprenoid-binding protein YceI
MTKWMLATAAAAVSLALMPAAAVARAWRVDPAHSTLTITNSYQGVRYTGRFNRFGANIVYDPADLAHAKFDVTVDVGSFDTQNAERDRTAKGPDFFDVAKYPRARFVTTAFHKGAGGSVLADGRLTLHGVTRAVTLTVEFAPAGNTATLDVSASLQRLAFGIGTGQWADTSMIGNGVTVHGHLSLRAGQG